ncbi:F-box protein [Quillaja saponaria]|uniref:F-box protein n=1 Tax=Quillaja saponaria TaxID=32244 RepID=A0AAD7PNU7_QUISA|nr:F-box protein [Quillaja saponaria]
MSNWVDLLPEILLVIAKKLISSEDFLASVAFGAVCTSWRSVYIKVKDVIKQLPTQVIWLMLAEERDHTDERGFFSLAKGNTRYLQLPEAKGKFCFSFPQGWLITTGKDLDLDLLHPLSRVQFQLPNLRTITKDFRSSCLLSTVINRALLTANPSLTSDFRVVIICDFGRLAFAKLGANSRTISKERYRFADVIYYNGNIYGVYPDGSIWVCDIEGYEPKATMLFHTKIGRFVPLFERMYLVESSGKLLAVLRTGGQARSLFEGSTIYSYGTAPFLVFELNISNRSCTRLESLENRALFVGRNSSISVNALNICGCKANSIYFTDDANESRDMGVWNMMDGRIETLFNPPLFCHVAPPLWVFPNFP